MDSPHTPEPADSEDSARAGRVLTVEQHAEYERPRQAAGACHRRVRGVSASVLLVLTLLLAPLAVDAARPGRRERLGSGGLGVLGGCGSRARCRLRGRDAVAVPRALLRLTAEEVVVEADAETVPAGVDGEHVLLPVPVVCRIVPGALRARVPRGRAGTRSGSAAPDWLRVTRLALGRRVTPGATPGAASEAG